MAGRTRGSGQARRRTGRFAVGARPGPAGFRRGAAGRVGRWRGEHSHGSDARPPRQRPPAAAGPGHGPRPRPASAASSAPATCRPPPTPAWSSGPAPPRRRSGDRVFVLGHHYQRDEVIEFADVTGDSFKLAKRGGRPAGRAVHRLLRCALHGRVAPTSSPTTGSRWSCPTWRPAARWPTWPRSARSRTRGTTWSTLGVADDVVPGDLHELLRGDQGVHRPPRRHGLHLVATPGRALQWAFDQRGGVEGTGKVLFLPDQHLGRNTAVRDLGLSLDDCVVFDPHKPERRPDPRAAASAPG